MFLALLCLAVPSPPQHTLIAHQANPSRGYIFMSSQGFPISPVSGGIGAADAVCQEEGNAIDSSIKWAALIVDESACQFDDGLPAPCRRASVLPNQGDGQINWILFPSLPYYRSDNTTFITSTDTNGFFSFPLNNTIVDNCVNQVSGINDDWTTEPNSSCDSWRDPTRPDAGVGWSCSNTTNVLNGGEAPCGSFSSQIFCVGPANSRTTDPLCGKHGECSQELCAIPAENFQECECRCGCSWSDSEHPRKHRKVTVQTSAGVVELKGEGATVVGEGLREAVNLVKGVGIGSSKLPNQMIFETSGTCSCGPSGAVPACNAQYPKPPNASIAALIAPDSPITSNDRITFFGDSITWLGGYIGVIRESLESVGVNATLINRGINGGKIKDIRDGISIFGQDYPDFDTALQQDQPTVVNIMIGINDVWWSGSNVTDFIVILMDLVGRVQRFGAKAAISTVSIIGEEAQGLNQFDKPLNDYAAATRFVSEVTGAALSDVHTAFRDYESRFNTLPTGIGLPSGVLTVDGVHPCMGGFNSAPIDTHGNWLLADTIVGGILQAFKN